MATLDSIKDLLAIAEVPLTAEEKALMESRPFKALCMYLDWAKRGTEYRYDDLLQRIHRINGVKP